MICCVAERMLGGILVAQAAGGAACAQKLGRPCQPVQQARLHLSSSRRQLLTPSFSATSDPVVVLVLSISFVFSVVLLHVGSKLARFFIK